MRGSGWRIGEGGRRGGDLCVGSGASFGEMEKLRVAGSVWGAEEAFLSPPEYGGPLAATFESEESSEDCEDYISGLAEEIAQSMLQEDDEASMKTAAAPWAVGVSKPAWSGFQMASSPTSPQSTLAGMGGYNWEVRSPGGNMDMGSSGVSSPPTPQEGDGIDVLYADILRVKLEDQVKLESQQQMLSLEQQIIQRPTTTTTTTTTSTPTAPASSNVLPSDNHLPFDEFSTLKTSKYGARSKGGGQELENYHFRAGRKQVGAGWGWGCGPIPHHHENSSGKGIINYNSKREEEHNHQFSLFASNMESNTRSLLLMNNRKQQQQHEGMRAVFLGSPTSRECGGTGVFLPRRLGVGSTQDSKRKSACSTVLLPSRIVHALNLNIEDTLPSPHRRDFPSSNSHGRRNPQVASRRSKPKDEVSSCYIPTSHPTTLQEVAPDISLPSEWTY